MHYKRLDMAKKKANKKDQELVTNCDHLEKSDNILSQSEIEGLILTIRGQQVLIDRDLATIWSKDKAFKRTGKT